eukprot:UN24493
MDGLLPPTWLEVSGCEGKRAALVEGIYTVRAKPLGNRTSYQKVADYETPVVLWYNSQRASWTISIFQNVKEAQYARNILAMVNDSTEIPHKISSTWHVVDHDSSAVVACSELQVKKTDPILIRITGRGGQMPTGLMVLLYKDRRSLEANIRSSVKPTVVRRSFSGTTSGRNAG